MEPQPRLCSQATLLLQASSLITYGENLRVCVPLVAGLEKIFSKHCKETEADTYFYSYRDNVCFEATRQDSTGSEVSAEAADTTDSE